MSSYDELDIGQTFTTPSRTFTDDDVDALVRLGGYTHPLFTDAAYAAASPFGRRPIPGEGVLHIMGGLIEQAELLDESVIALVGFEQVAFRAPGFAGDTVRVECEVLDKDARERTGTITFAWRCVNQAGELLVETRARMLFRLG